MSKPRQSFVQMCPACHANNEVLTYKKVTIITPVIAKMTCERCRCRFIVRVEKAKHLGPGQVQITPKLTYISPDGERFIRAQEILRQAKAKEALKDQPTP